MESWKKFLPRRACASQREALISRAFSAWEASAGVRCTWRLRPQTPRAESLGPEVAGKIVVVGSLISAETVEQARQAGAVGLIGGGLRDSDLRDLLGRDLGVAITGTEQIGLTVVATEGFGRIAMARKTFDILQACAGMDASMAGATQIRAGVLRPEIIVPYGC